MEDVIVVKKEPLTEDECQERRVNCARLLAQVDKLQEATDALRAEASEMTAEVKDRIKEARKLGREATDEEAELRVDCWRVPVSDRLLVATLRKDSLELVSWDEMSDFEKRKAQQAEVPGTEEDAELVQAAVERLDALTKQQRLELRAG